MERYSIPSLPVPELQGGSKFMGCRCGAPLGSKGKAPDQGVRGTESP